MKCETCGKEMKHKTGGFYTCDCGGSAVYDLRYSSYLNSDDWSYKPNTNSYDVPFPIVRSQGWICSKCGASLSPSTAYCPFCSPSKITYTSGDRTGEIGDNITIDKSTTDGKFNGTVTIG